MPRPPRRPAVPPVAHRSPAEHAGSCQHRRVGRAARGDRGDQADPLGRQAPAPAPRRRAATPPPPPAPARGSRAARAVPVGGGAAGGRCRRDGGPRHARPSARPRRRARRRARSGPPAAGRSGRPGPGSAATAAAASAASARAASASAIRGSGPVGADRSGPLQPPSTAAAAGRTSASRRTRRRSTVGAAAGSPAPRLAAVASFTAAHPARPLVAPGAIPWRTRRPGSGGFLDRPHAPARYRPARRACRADRPGVPTMSPPRPRTRSHGPIQPGSRAACRTPGRAGSVGRGEDPSGPGRRRTNCAAAGAGRHRCRVRARRARRPQRRPAAHGPDGGRLRRRGGLDDIARLSRAASDELDRNEHLIGGSYTLEVTSPGVDRPLTVPRHWRRAHLRLVTVRPQPGSALGDAVFAGRVGTAGEESVTLLVDGRLREVRYADVAHAPSRWSSPRPPRRRSLCSTPARSRRTRRRIGPGGRIRARLGGGLE